MEKEEIEKIVRSFTKRLSASMSGVFEVDYDLMIEELYNYVAKSTKTKARKPKVVGK